VTRRHGGRGHGPMAVLVALVVLGLAGGASAHPTLVLGELRVSPDPPVAGEPLRISLTLAEPSMAPVEDAVVLVELREHRPETAAVPAASTEAPTLAPAEVERDLVEVAPARYEAEVVLDRAATYHLLIRDRTFEWEEANASVLIEVGGDPLGTLPFILPPTAIGPRSVWTWLAWLIGLPVVAGIVVTLLVLGSGRSSGAPPA
jgi:hypothetical protein